MRKNDLPPLLFVAYLCMQTAALADERCAGPHAALMSPQAQAVPAGVMARGEQELAGGIVLAVGHAYDMQLSPQDKVAFVAKPERERAPASGATGGMVRFSVEAPGRYRVSLSSRHWVDVLSGRTIVPSVSHQGHLGCEGLHKTIDYELASGEYLLQLSGGEGDAVRVAIVARDPRETNSSH